MNEHGAPRDTNRVSRVLGIPERVQLPPLPERERAARDERNRRIARRARRSGRHTPVGFAA